jgi:hypothetical protein
MGHNVEISTFTSLIGYPPSVLGSDMLEAPLT